MTYEEMSDDKWFFEDPAFAWGVNYTQLEMYRNTPPHAGYRFLLHWAQTLGKPWYVFTSNIDGHFEKAGFPQDRVVTCHGDIHHLQCVNQNCKAERKEDNVWSAEGIPQGLADLVDQASLRFSDMSPLEEAHFRCPRCSGLARPNIWFCSDRNHAFWVDEGERRQAYIKWLEGLQAEGKHIVVIECGGGMDIPTVRCEGEDAVNEAGSNSLLVRINPTDCRVPAEKAVGLPFGAKEGCERIAQALAVLQAVNRGGGGGAVGRGSAATGRSSSRGPARSTSRGTAAGGGRGRGAPAAAAAGHRRASPGRAAPPRPAKS